MKLKASMMETTDGMSVLVMDKIPGNVILSNVMIVMETDMAEYLVKLIERDQFKYQIILRHARTIIDAEYESLLGMSKDDLFDYLSGYKQCYGIEKYDSDSLWYNHIEPL